MLVAEQTRMKRKVGEAMSRASNSKTGLTRRKLTVVGDQSVTGSSSFVSSQLKSNNELQSRRGSLSYELEFPDLILSKIVDEELAIRSDLDELVRMRSFLASGVPKRSGSRGEGEGVEVGRRSVCSSADGRVEEQSSRVQGDDDRRSTSIVRSEER